MALPGGLAFEAPPGFVRESTSVALRATPESGLAEAGLRGPVRPNLLVERRPAPAGASLSQCVAAIQADLVRSIPGLRGFDSLDARFADGATGIVLGYTFPAPRAADVVLAQLQAIRLDGATLTTITITTTLSNLTETRRDQFLRILASARLAADADQEPKEQPS